MHGIYSDDDLMRLWAADGTPLAILKGHTDWVSGALTLADGRFLSWSSDDTLRLWAADGTPLVVFEGHTARVNGVLVLPDGHFLSWSYDKTLRLWAADETPLAVFQGHTSSVDGVLALPNARFLSWSPDRTLSLWAADGVRLDFLDEPKWGDREKISRWAAQHGFDPQELYNDQKNRADQRLQIGGKNTIVLFQDGDDQALGKFYTDAPIKAGPVFSTDGVTIAAGDTVGRVLFLRWRDR